MQHREALLVGYRRSRETQRVPVEPGRGRVQHSATLRVRHYARKRTLLFFAFIEAPTVETGQTTGSRDLRAATRPQIREQVSVFPLSPRVSVEYFSSTRSR
eukprot:GHVU01215133.1.p3 GENE.GHVU01215133.1~~GHVU01215133.1.p3  ORF type:complete len:101 (-),score=7.14 GHVU01215133.1:328-630(-)